MNNKAVTDTKYNDYIVSWKRDNRPPMSLRVVAVSEEEAKADVLKSYGAYGVMRNLAARKV